MVNRTRQGELRTLVRLSADAAQSKCAQLQMKLRDLTAQRHTLNARQCGETPIGFPLGHFEEWRRKRLADISVEEAQLRAALEPLKRAAARAEARANVLDKLLREQS